MNIKYITIFTLLLIWSCKPEFDVPNPTSGDIDFSRYVAVGNSLTAGYADGGLYAEGQMNAYPKLIAIQMNEVSEIIFTQPDIPGNGSGYIYVKSLDLTGSSPKIKTDTRLPDPAWLDKLPDNYNNLGIPGIRIKDINIAGYGASPTEGNPYFYRLLNATDAAKSYLDKVEESTPTFFTSWMGNNDVLGYAKEGGVYGISGQGPAGINGLTDPLVFESNYNDLIDILEASNAKGVLLTIPDITLTPFFSTVPWNGLALTQAQADMANSSYAAMINPGIESQVKASVIELTVTMKVISENVTEGFAEMSVYQKKVAEELGNGHTQQEAEDLADAYISSPEGIAEIEALTNSLNANLGAHLQGNHDGHPELEPIYVAIDTYVSNDTDIQNGIATGIAQLTEAYDNNLLDPAQQEQLATAIEQNTSAQIELLKAAGFYPDFHEGPNPFVIEDDSPHNPLGIRHIKEGELILLTAMISGQLTPEKAALPKPDSVVLNAGELKNIVDYTKEYNDIIRGFASNDIVIFDPDETLESIKSGVFVDGVTVTGSYLTGGIFSVDGIHLTPRGNAMIANDVIKKINETFHSTIPPVNVNNYRGVILP